MEGNSGHDPSAVHYGLDTNPTDVMGVFLWTSLWALGQPLL